MCSASLVDVRLLSFAPNLENNLELKQGQVILACSENPRKSEEAFLPDSDPTARCPYSRVDGVLPVKTG